MGQLLQDRAVVIPDGWQHVECTVDQLVRIRAQIVGFAEILHKTFQPLSLSLCVHLINFVVIFCDSLPLDR